MNDTREAIGGVRAELADLVSGVFSRNTLHGASDEDLLETVRAVGDLQRLVEALLVDGVAEIVGRSGQMDRGERLSTRMGCHNVNELVQRLTLCAPQTAARLEKAQRATALEWNALTGEEQPAKLPALRDALRDGAVGLDGVVAVSAPLLGMRDRVERSQVLIADDAIAAFARGGGVDDAPPASAELLKIQALVWASALDPDGDEPKDRDTAQSRSFTMGKQRDDNLTPFRGLAEPEVAAQLQRIFDSVNSPSAKSGVWFAEATGEAEAEADAAAEDVEAEAAWVDQRTRAQKQYDALAAALFAAARSGELPALGGAAPTLLVTVNAEDLARGAGWAFLEGIEQPVSLNTATHTACAGVLQRVILGGNGRIVELGSPERTFTPQQRKAITLRDGGCIIPGCGIPAAWCEIHHVVDHAKGGATHTDNGVCLCWGHHRFIDTGPWEIRMRDGVPEIRGPAWFDPSGRWRRVTKSKTRLLRALRRQ
jgi:hypothetical protein